MSTRFDEHFSVDLEFSEILRGGLKGRLRPEGIPQIGIHGSEKWQEKGISIYGSMRSKGGGATYFRVDIDGRDFPTVIAAMRAANPNAFNDALAEATK